MTAALRLAERGCRVSLLEAGDRLGGKAGASWNGAGYDDHGFHIFPLWYLNTWQLVGELGIRDNFVDMEDFLHLRAGEFPDFKRLHNVGSPMEVLANIFSGVLPPDQMFLFFYSVLDLVSQHFRERSLLDQITSAGFIRSRFYRTETVAKVQQDLMLKGISVPSYAVSAMTVRKVAAFWVRYSTPVCRIPRGNLQQSFIEPFESRLRKLGVDIVLANRLERLCFTGAALTHLRVQNGGGHQDRPVQRVVLAVPVEQVAALIDDDVFRVAPDLAQVRAIRTRPMASLNLEFARRLSGIPRNHVNLPDSRFGLSFIDVSQTWPGLTTTCLNVIASDFTPLETISDNEAIDALFEELRRFLPVIERAEVSRLNFQPHRNQPLFMNDAGIWQFRPRASTEIPNLFLAGDYCRTHVDLVSMESAVTSGLHAAEAVRKRLRIEPAVEVKEPEELPRWLLLAGKVALLPTAAAAKIWTMARGG
jgi:uncharacterized protein with NAD-binding domain and iron-sulfur cluster